MRNHGMTIILLSPALFMVPPAATSAGRMIPDSPPGVFNVRDYGATGFKNGSAQAAIQKAIDACAAAGGGMVYVPPGSYSTGTLRLRSHVRVFVEAGAVIYSIKDRVAFDKDALFYGEDLTSVSLEGRGTIDGQGAYERRKKGDFHDDFIYPNQVEMEKLGKPLVRSFPKADQFGKLVLLLWSKDVRIMGLSFIDSPSWTMHLYACERVVIDGVHIRSSLRDVIAHGKGSSVCSGHPENWLEGVTMDNVKLFIAHDPAAAYDKAVNALEFRYARNLNLENIEVLWEGPGFSQWKSALSLRDIDGLTLEGFSGRQAHIGPGASAPAISLENVRDAFIRDCRAQQGTDAFLGFRGKDTEDIALEGNDFRNAAVAYTIDKDARPSAIQDLGGVLPRKKT